MRTSSVIFILLVLSIVCFGQDGQIRKRFTLLGSLKGRDTGMIVLWHPGSDGKYVKDTARLYKGEFKFQGSVYEPSYVHLIGSNKPGNYGSFFLEQGDQCISLEENDFDDLMVTGSFTQQQADSLNAETKRIFSNYKEWISENDAVLRRYLETKDSTEKITLGKKLDSIKQRNTIIYDSSRKETINFIISHPDSYVSPSYLYTFLTNRTITTDSAEDLYDRFSVKIKNSITGRLIQEELKKRRLNIKAPDFTAKDITGKELSLSEFKGEYVLLDFWASWCIPCLNQIPDLKNFLKKYKSQGFEVIAISIDNKKEKWEASIKKNSIANFHHVLANEDVRLKYSNPSQPIPSQILINRQGIIIWNSMHSSTNITKTLEKEFGE